ncbi:MAG: flagellar motor switch protein FliM [Acidimicrobiales bacterium]
MSGSSVLIERGDQRVHKFNFERHESIDRVRIRRLHPVLETMAHRVASALGSALRQPAHVSLTGTDQVTWEENAAELPDPTFLATATVLPLEGRFVLHLPVPLSLQLVDVYLGGDGRSSPDRPKLTDIETRLVSDIVDELLAAVPPAFNAFIELRLGAVQKVSSPMFIQPSRPGEMCLRIELAVAIGDHEPHAVHLTIPLTAATPILEAFERLQRADAGDTGAPPPQVHERLMAVPVDLTVGYPPIGLSPTDLVELRPGDVIPLHQLAKEGETLLEVVVGGVPFGRGTLVERGKTLACRLASRREEAR